MAVAPWAAVLLCLLAAADSARSQVGQKPALRHGSALQVTAFGCLAGTALTMPFAGQLVRLLQPRQRSYGHPIVLRPVTSEDAMTAD